MKIFGMALILFSSLIFCREKSRAAERRVMVLEEIFRLADAMKIEIGCYLRPIGEIVSSFSSPILSECGFVSDFVSLGAYEAYLRLQSQLCFNEEEKNLLGTFFSRLGRGYAEDEIKLIEVFSSQLSAMLKKERENLPRQKKLSATLSCAAALAVIILLV